MKIDLNKLYNEICYPCMTWGDVKKIDALNKKHHYGISYIGLKRLIKQHQRAREENDKRTMSKIEYRLTDINFHTECSLLHSGKYDEALALEW